MTQELDRLLEAYLDGALSPARQAAVQKRLGEARVARRLAQLQALRQGLRAAAPQPRPEQSRRMWLAIQAQVAAPAKAPWYAFLQRRWLGPAWGYGLAGAAAVLGLVLIFPGQRGPLQPQAQPMALEAEAGPMAAAAPAPARTRASQPRLAERSAPAPAAVTAARPRARTEVERALAEDPVDGLIERFLAEQAARRASPASGATLAAFGSPMRASAAPRAAVPAESFDSSAISQAQGGPDQHGFWDWGPAGEALNRRDWQTARLELEAAQARAREASERAFASSALTLLAASGQPLAGTQPVLPQDGALRVLAAGSWQLQMDARLARFSRGYSARLPGFRVEGDYLLLDMTFDRGSFSPGSRFTRVSGEPPARVFDAQARPMEDGEFTAPAGAVYNVQERELRLR